MVPFRSSDLRSLPCRVFASAGLCLLVFAGQLPAQETTPPGHELPAFHEYEPPSTLVVPETGVPKAKYPFVDVHSHQWSMPEQDLLELTAAMDALGMEVMVNLSGRGFRRAQNPDGSFRLAYRERGWLKRAIDNARENAPGRFLVFTNLDVTGIDEPGWRERTLRLLQEDAAAGAAGLKIYKGLGLDRVDGSGRRIPVDDPRLDPVWAACGELGLVVLIHTAEPAAFWLPKDGSNERLLEMIEKPERWRGEPGAYPSWESLIAEQHRVFARHPETTFVNAHFGWMANDLGRLGELLRRLPNVYVEFGAVIAELGRQPRFARRWLIEHQDRVLFGKDSWNPSEYPLYFQVLETDDDYIRYFRRRHAFWRLYGLALPDEVLRKIYYANALRLFPQLDRSRFPK
ncbi:MAG: amidohydrolase [Holophagales bacterium]|nr:amidohydrolase [Holophagales bacterium]